MFIFPKAKGAKPLRSSLLMTSRASIITRGIKQDHDLSKELTFKSFQLLPNIVSVLEHQLGFVTPTPIQRMAIPQLIKGNSALLAAQTGTGKTLAYTIPIIHRLKQAELQNET